MVTVAIRAMDEADVPVVSEIRVRGWQWAYEGIVPAGYLATMDPAEDAARRREFFATSRGRVRNLLAVVRDDSASGGGARGDSPEDGSAAGASARGGSPRDDSPQGGSATGGGTRDSSAAGGSARGDSPRDDSASGGSARERVVGWAAFGPYRGEPDTTADCELYALYLRPEWAGRGVGRALMAEVVRQAAAQGRERLLLWVLADNARARRFYAAAGFAPDGTEATDTFDGVSLSEVRYARDLRNAASAAAPEQPTG
ncbi:GNAT family N-acetyltransferase [Actinacidiphila sp. DG2A-62]|uniref:GNAT family N-acetyltransferase n=1 Tax=Actinacidiphila sp. DG2A-62 TaxID=3108821 RepID=UPI002DBAF8B5|nr:GNAT family N-acetyltransferase [Actinacidiphila sp. DG2A-62]MEC3997902.1 GNAT family N-acetyltransferase [Actinacidiphila sp. DG2A-62]